MTPFLAIPTLILAMGLHGGSTIQGPVNWHEFADEHRDEITHIQDKLKDMRDVRRADHPMVSAQNRAAVNSALDAGDYKAFVEATDTAPFAGKVTEDKFNAMVEARSLFVAGDKDGAKQVLINAGMHAPTKTRLNHFTPNHMQHHIKPGYDVTDSVE